MFNVLQKIGKALMTPIAILPVAAILLRLGFGDIFTGDIANILKSAGESIFNSLPLLFGIGIAYGLAKDNNGAAALSGAVGVIVAQAIYTTIDPNVNMGVFIGIIIGIIAGISYNQFHNIVLPEFLGFFAGKRFVPIITVFFSIIIGVLAGYFWHVIQLGIDTFSNYIISLNEIGTFIYGTLNRLLIPLGLHHILNSVFWFQLGEYSYLKDGIEVVANGDLHRFFAGDTSAGTYMSGFYVTMMFGLPAMALAIYLTTKKELRNKVGTILAGVALTSFITGITEPLEFLFLFIAPVLFVIHAILTGLALATAQILDIHAGFGFSAGLIDYIINYKLSTNPILILPLGLVFGLIYFFTTFYIIKKFNLKIFDESDLKTDESSINEIDSFIEALGGAQNIVNTDACITRLRMTLKNSSNIKENTFMSLGAKGVIKPDSKSIQIILGTKADTIATKIKERLNSN